MSAHTSAIGIDLGSSRAVMGVVKGAGVEIVLSDTSARSVPAMVAYTEHERLGGESVKTQQRKNFKNSLTFLTRFLGLNGACAAQIELEKKFVTFKVVTGKNNKLEFPVTHQGEAHNFNIEQVLALYLVKLKEFYQLAGHVCEGVFTCPSYFSNVERQGLKDAIEIAGIKCFRIINESTAIALNYGYFRRKDFTNENPRTVAFIDFGHSKTTITMARFTVDTVTIISHISDRNLGGRDFDCLIMEKLGGEFEQKFGCDPREAPRGRLRMMEGIEKARKILSADKEASINIDFLMEEEDMNRNLKRDEFEEIIDPVTQRFGQLLFEALQISGLNPDDFHSVELVGDATRTPKLQEIIKQVYGKQELSRTLNAVECLARGASLQAAILSSKYGGEPIEIKDWNA
jgi:heat shock protein 4